METINMAKTPKIETRKMEAELGVGCRVTNIVPNRLDNRLEHLKKATLAGSIWQIVTARTQPDATSAISKVAFEYDVETGDFLFTNEEIISIREFATSYVDIDKILEARQIVRNLNQENN